MKKRVTQKEVIFYILYQAYKQNPDEYIPVYDLMGEIYIPELSLWGYVSYECSARASEIRRENPGLIEITTITGKTGAKYFGYKFNSKANIELIKDEKLLSFYKILKIKNLEKIEYDNKITG